MVLPSQLEKTYEVDFQRIEALIGDINKTIVCSKELAASIILIQIEIEDIRTQVLSAKLRIASVNEQNLNFACFPATVAEASRELHYNVDRLKQITTEYTEAFDVFMKMIDLLRNTGEVYNRKINELGASWEYWEHQEHINLVRSFLHPNLEEPVLTDSEERRVRCSSQEKENNRTIRVMKRVINSTPQIQKIWSEKVKRNRASEIGESSRFPLIVEEESEEDDILKDFIVDENQKVENAENIMADTEQQEGKRYPIDAEVRIEEGGATAKQPEELKSIPGTSMVDKSVDHSETGAIRKQSSQLTTKIDSQQVRRYLVNGIWVTEEQLKAISEINTKVNVVRDMPDPSELQSEPSEPKSSGSTVNVQPVEGVPVEEVPVEVVPAVEPVVEPAEVLVIRSSTEEQPTKGEDKKETESRVELKSEESEKGAEEKEFVSENFPTEEEDKNKTESKVESKSEESEKGAEEKEVASENLPTEEEDKKKTESEVESKSEESQEGAKKKFVPKSNPAKKK